MRISLQKHSPRCVDRKRRPHSSTDEHVHFVFVPLPKCSQEPWAARVQPWLRTLACIRYKLPAAKKAPTKDDEMHLARYGGRLKGGSSLLVPIISEKDEEIARREYARFVIRFATFVDGLQEGMQFTIFYLLKEHFSLQPAQVSLCFGLMTLPWLLKPLYAYISDFFPIQGEKRRPYIIAMSLLKACCYVGVGMSSTVPQAMLFLTLSAACRAFVCATLQGFLIEEKRVDGADTADLVSEYFWIRGFGTLCTAYFSGTLLSVATSPQILLTLAVLPLTVAGLSVFIQEKTQEIQGTHWDHLASLKQLVQSASFFGPMLFLLSYSSGPDYDDAMNFYYINQLHFSPEWMGRLKVIHSDDACHCLGFQRFPEGICRNGLREYHDHGQYWSRFAADHYGGCGSNFGLDGHQLCQHDASHCAVWLLFGVSSRHFAVYS
eukprot:GEMP01025467.1.p1 GENE.GEMP01025467.1~~GEMP01025467.1.p1  ORF type:complete len:434 (+),score=61.21 GEMP01025467.1:357-1658(+)